MLLVDLLLLALRAGWLVSTHTHAQTHSHTHPLASSCTAGRVVGESDGGERGGVWVS
jgi:hypothetical protein